MRSRMRGGGRGGCLGGDGPGAVEGGQGAVEALGGVGVQGEQRLAGAHGVAGLGVQHHAGAGLYRLLLAGPAGAQPPGGDADRQRVQPLEHAVGVGAGTSWVSLRPGRSASGSPSWAAIIRRHTSIADPSASLSAGSTSSIPAPASISRASARVSSTTSAGPAPGQHLHRLAHLQRVARGQPERCLPCR